MFMYGMVDTISFLQLFIPLFINSLLLTYSITIICVGILSMSLSSLFISINSLNLKWILLLLLLLYQLPITTHITTLPVLLLLLRYSDDIDFNIIIIVMISITIINITIIIDNNNDINNNNNNNNHNHPSTYQICLLSSYHINKNVITTKGEIAISIIHIIPPCLLSRMRSFTSSEMRIGKK